MRHDSHPTKPPYGRHGGAYKGRWSTTTPTDGVEGGDRGGGEGRSRGACGQSVTGVRSGGRTPGRVAERWPSEAETPERRAHTPCAASPGGHEAAPRRQHRETQDAEDNIGGGYYAGPGLARAADLACSAARPNGGRLSPSPGLRVTLPCPADAWQAVACRSEPGILSARPLRGSESVNAIRRGEERGSQREP